MGGGFALYGPPTRPAVYYMSEQDMPVGLQRMQNYKRIDLLPPVYVCDPSPPDSAIVDDYSSRCSCCAGVFGPQSLVVGPGNWFAEPQKALVCVHH